MELSADLLAQYERDGRVIFGNMFGSKSRPLWVPSRNAVPSSFKADDGAPRVA